MIAGVKDWLPRDAFRDAAVRAVLSGPVTRWSGRWLARDTAAVAAVSRDADGWWPEAQVVAGALADARLSGPGKRRLLEAALDVDLAGQTLAQDDRRVMDDFALRAAGDLVAVLDEAFAKDAGREGASRIRVTLSLSGDEALAVTLPEHVLVPALKARLGAARRKDAAPRGRLEALAPLRLVAEGVLGNAELALSDLDALGVGDVVILDRALNDPVELRVAANRRRIGQGRLGRNGGRVAIQF